MEYNTEVAINKLMENDYSLIAEDNNITNKYVKYILKSIDEINEKYDTKAIVAGGACFNLYFNKSLRADESDIDIFLIGSGKDAYELICDLVGIFGEPCEIDKNFNVIEFSAGYTIQIITKVFKDIIDIFKHFDLYCCMFAMDSYSVYYTDLAKYSIDTKSVIFDSRKFNLNYVNRLYKYMSKGLEFRCPEYQENTDVLDKIQPGDAFVYNSCPKTSKEFLNEFYKRNLVDNVYLFMEFELEYRDGKLEPLIDEYTFGTCEPTDLIKKESLRIYAEKVKENYKNNIINDVEWFTRIKIPEEYVKPNVRLELDDF